jgi:NADH-quinone oxidoreductase subunit M
VGEFLVLIGTFATSRLLAVIGAIGVVLSAIYLLWAYQRVMHGEPRLAPAQIGDVSVREYAILTPIVLAIVAIGVFPRPLLERIEPAAERHAQVIQIESDQAGAEALGGK